MSTSLQLIPAYLDSKPVDWRRDYVKNMRSIRGYPTYWRIRDDIAYIDGPPAERERYTRELFTWSIEIVKDAQGNNTDTFEVYNTQDKLARTTTTVGGDTEYRYQWTKVPPNYTYQHTDIIDSVSIEFDQNARPIIAYEAAGIIWLYWYDPQAQVMKHTDWGAGSNPCLVSTSYRRVGPVTSERLLFYLDTTSGLVVYRRQSDRYGIKHQLPPTSAPAVELLKASKNLYGGITCVVGCGVGELAVENLTALPDVDTLHIGTDTNNTSSAVGNVLTGAVPSFDIAEKAVRVLPVEYPRLTLSTGALVSFNIRPRTVVYYFEPSAGTVSAVSGNVLQFDILFEDPEVNVAYAPPGRILTPVAGSILQFTVKETLIRYSQGDAGAVALSTGNLLQFDIGGV